MMTMAFPFACIGIALGMLIVVFGQKLDPEAASLLVEDYGVWAYVGASVNLGLIGAMVGLLVRDPFQKAVDDHFDEEAAWRRRVRRNHVATLDRIDERERGGCL